jgi:hypothetical protein
MDLIRALDRVEILQRRSARADQLRELPEGVGAEDQPLVLLEHLGAPGHQLGAFLAPVAAPVAAAGVGAEAVERAEDVERKRGGHAVLLRELVGVRLGPATKTIASGNQLLDAG